MNDGLLRTIPNCLEMYGPPRATAREKLLDEESLRQCIRPMCGEDLLAMMRYERACPDKGDKEVFRKDGDCFP